MTHKKHRRRIKINAQVPDKAAQNGSESKARRKKKKDVDRSDYTGGDLSASE